MGISTSPTPIWIRETPDHLKTQKMCEKAVHMEPRSLKYVPDHFKSEGMCERTIEKAPYLLRHVPNQYKTGDV